MKKKTCLLIPVGEETAPIFAGFRHVSNIDKVFLVHSAESLAVAKEIYDKINLLYDTELLRVKPDNLLDIMSKILPIIRTYSIVSNITGGTKIMSLSAYLSSLVTGGKAFYIFKDNSRTRYQEIPLIRFTYQDIGSSKRKLQILRILSEKELSLSELSYILKLHKTTVEAHLKSLLQKECVQRIDRKYSATPLGNFIQKYYEGVDK